MSWIIKKITDHKKRVVMLFLLLAVLVVVLIFRMYILAALLIAVVAANELTVRKMRKRKTPFDPRSKTRNVDFLVIGDIGTEYTKIVAEQGTAVEICLPGCTLAGAYEVLRHTFSILKESGGKAVLVVPKKHLNINRYSLFDVSFFHVVTINRLRLRSVQWMSHFPVIFAPVNSLRFLFGIQNKKPKVAFHDAQVEKFCLERGIEGTVLTI